MKPFLDKENQREAAAKLLDVEKPVQVYRNLQRKCWSVRQDGIVRYHTDHVFIRDAEFKVSQAGRERVLRERSKNVHAVIAGLLACPRTETWNTESLPGEPVTYNPYKYDSFVKAENEDSVKTANWVDMVTGSTIPVIAWGAK